MHDESLFPDIVARHKDMLYRICCAYTNDPDERKDIYQEVLVHVWKGLGSFRKEAELRTWLYRIAVNTCLTWLRGERRRGQWFTRPNPADMENAPSDQPDILESDDTLKHLYDGIAELRPVDRMIVSLYLEENSHLQIATVMGISEGNVRVKLHRIKAELKKLCREVSYES